MARKQIPVEWRKVKVITILKPGMDPDSPKHYCPISLLSVTFKLYERLLQHRLSSIIDPKQTPDQDGFHPDRSCAEQVLNLTQHIEDGYHNRKITGFAFVDLFSAYDTMQQWLMIYKVHTLIGDSHMCNVMQSLFTNK